jgi:hypothetical protein
MWKFIKDLWTACLFIIGLRQKQKPVLPPVETKTDELEVTLNVPLAAAATIHTTDMRSALIKARNDIMKPLSDLELEKVIDNFLQVVLPAEYKKYLKSPASNLGGDWIIITYHHFRNSSDILRQALPIIIERLGQYNIRAADRVSNYTLWVYAPNITSAIEKWEKYPTLTTLFNQSSQTRNL